jgi:hypothetical protein
MRYPIMRTLLAAGLLQPLLQQFVSQGSISAELIQSLRGLR